MKRLTVPHRRLRICASVGPVLTTDKLLADPRWEKLLRDLMLEVIAAAGALGFEIPVAFAEEQIERTRTMGAYKASTLLDFERAGRWNWRACFSNRCAGRKRPACPCRGWPRFAKCCGRQLTIEPHAKSCRRSAPVFIFHPCPSVFIRG